MLNYQRVSQSLYLSNKSPSGLSHWAKTPLHQSLDDPPIAGVPTKPILVVLLSIELSQYSPISMELLS